MALYAFDGTWQNHLDNDDPVEDTNVWKFFEAYEKDEKKYIEGVGTRLGKFGKIMGGFSGVGGIHRIHEMHKALCKFYASGDHEIDIIGFSRGAAMALSFANHIRRKGIKDPATGRKIARKPPIRFLGLWDVVGSFGIAINVLFIPFHKINLGYDLHLSKYVTHCYHALAMDERRQTFRPTKVRKGHEVWFRGVHSDIGGGNRNVGLNAITMHWMLLKGKAVGLPIAPARIDKAKSEIDAAAAIKPAGFDLVKNRYRILKTSDRFHYTVAPRPKHKNPPDGSLRETPEDEVKGQLVLV